MCIYFLSLKRLWCDTYKLENRDQATSSSRKGSPDMLLRDIYKSRAYPEIYIGLWGGGGERGPSPSANNSDNVLLVFNLSYGEGPIGYSERI